MPADGGADHLAGERAALLAQLRRQGIRDGRVLAAMERVPRERFVPADVAADAYADRALPIGSGQTISQPFIVARMTELLRPVPHHRVLEVGTGSAYQAAVLAELAAEVVTIERKPELAERAAALLRELGLHNVRVVVGDGSLGYPEAAPYDGIIVTAATPGIPQPLIEQCRVGGRIVAPVGGLDFQTLTVIVKHADGLERREIEGVRFVPLVGERGFEEDD